MSLDFTYNLLLSVLKQLAAKTDSKVDDVMVAILDSEGPAIKKAISELGEPKQADKTDQNN